MNTTPGALPKLLILVLTLLALGVAHRLWRHMERGEGPDEGRRTRPVPVEVAEVRRGTLDDIRVFSGTLEPSADTRVAAKVAGRVAEVRADLADPVTRGQILAVLDDAEFRQALTRAEADLAVANARRTEARNRLEIARREQDRVSQLAERGISSASALDEAKAGLLVRTSAVEVAESEVHAAEAEVETARIRLGDTRVRATWSGGDDTRVVAERTVGEGDTVQANAPMFRVIEIQPVRAVFHVPERDYSRLRPGQSVTLRTDAWPGEAFDAEITRVSPVFQEESRQARVELRAANPDNRLKPGMFVRASVVMDHVEDAVLVPESAITRRGNETGVFRVADGPPAAEWVPVTPGIRSAGTVQLVGSDLRGQVVTLGQQLLDDGSRLILPGERLHTP